MSRIWICWHVRVANHLFGLTDQRQNLLFFSCKSSFVLCEKVHLKKSANDVRFGS